MKCCADADLRDRFVVEDEKYNYLSGRFPPDAELLAKNTVEMVKRLKEGS